MSLRTLEGTGLHGAAGAGVDGWLDMAYCTEGGEVVHCEGKPSRLGIWVSGYLGIVVVQNE